MSSPTRIKTVLAILALSVLVGAVSFAVFRPNLAASLLATALILVVLQTLRLLKPELKLTKKLHECSSRLVGSNGNEVRSRLQNGLRLIDTVLSPQETVVFRVDENQSLVPAARHRRSHSGRLDLSPNSIWREGISLCEAAIRAGDLVTQKRNPDELATNVALPLHHEQYVVGALLLRLGGEFDPRDRELLLAVGEQLARNLQQEIAGKPSMPGPLTAYLSSRSARTRLDLLDALDGLITEQQFVARSLEEISDGLAIAYLDGMLAHVNSPLMQLANISSEDLGRLNLFDLLDALKAGVFNRKSVV